MQNMDKHFAKSQKSLLSWAEWDTVSGSKKLQFFRTIPFGFKHRSIPETKGKTKADIPLLSQSRLDKTGKINIHSPK